MASKVVAVPDLLRQLAFAGVARPAALRGALGGISAQTLSRLVAEAGEDVLRMGRGPATEYARTRTVEGIGRAISAFRVDAAGQPRPDGTLRFLWGGRTYWQHAQAGRVHQGLPPELVDMAPQGFLGRAFSARFPELRLPPRLTDWSDDHRLMALARRGEDCVGDLIVGDESFDRFMVDTIEDAPPEEFAALAIRSATELVGSSAGGERPKFAVFSQGRHVLVKFVPDTTADVARRWRDLLWCEWKALELLAAAGRPAARSRLVDQDGWRFLEIERFDRVGARGRRALLSLFAINNEYLGIADSWTSAAPLLVVPPFFLPEADASLMRWLDVWGQLTGNTDRHFGNISYLVEQDGRLRLAPAYDMSPMILAPSADVLVPRHLEPAPPTGRTLDVWLDAAMWAQRFWAEVRDSDELAPELREFAVESHAAIAKLAERVAPG
jgi:hypothetical protein